MFFLRYSPPLDFLNELYVVRVYYILVVSIYYVLGSILYMVERHTGLRMALIISEEFDVFTLDTQGHLVQNSYLVADITEVQRKNDLIKWLELELESRSLHFWSSVHCFSLQFLLT